MSKHHHMGGTDRGGRRRRRRPLRTVMAAALAVLGAAQSVLSGEPAAASGTTSGPPYARSGSYWLCDPGTTSCRGLVSADHATGRLSVDLSVIGSEEYSPYACGAQWTFPPNPWCAGPPVAGTGVYGRAWLTADGVVPPGVSAVKFTVEVEGSASTTASGGSASAVLRAFAVQPERCETCTGGWTEQTLVSSALTPSAEAVYTELEFTYRSTSGSVPAGPIQVGVGISGDARGPGLHEVKASATVTRITAEYQL